MQVLTCKHAPPLAADEVEELGLPVCGHLKGAPPLKGRTEQARVSAVVSSTLDQSVSREPA